MYRDCCILTQQVSKKQKEEYTMTNENRNRQIDTLEQNIILALENSYEHYKKTWESQISFSDYIQALRIGIEHPELVDWLKDDNEKWWKSGGKAQNVYDILAKGVE